MCLLNDTIAPVMIAGIRLKDMQVMLGKQTAIAN
jgi:hypothetical protein